MSKEAILKAFYFLITIPVKAAARFLLVYDIFQLKANLEKCINVVDEKKSCIPESYVSYLMAAEDHRSKFHFGIDQIAMLRAFFKNIIHSEAQGASTIEQQFVRVVTGNYSYSFKRKLKEQILAVMLVQKRAKCDIAKSYLAIAYYGSKCDGVEGVKNLIGSDLINVSENKIISVVARLKYPKPLSNLVRWEKKLDKRVNYIRKRHKKVIGKTKAHFFEKLV